MEDGSLSIRTSRSSSSSGGSSHVLGAKAVPGARNSVDEIDYVVTWKSEKNQAFTSYGWQLRAEPPVLEVSPDAVFPKVYSVHLAKCIAVLTLCFLLVLRAPILGAFTGSSMLTKVIFEGDGQVHLRWEWHFGWVVAEKVASLLLLSAILPFTNRDLLKMQRFAFDTVIIVANFIWWGMTRGMSESCVFEGAFGGQQYLTHVLGAVHLPLIFIVACLDSVKMAHRTKLVVIGLMIAERGFQYVKHMNPSGIFSNEGVCHLVGGVSIPARTLMSSNQSANATIIVFLLKSFWQYARGYHFAVIKPRYKMVCCAERSTSRLGRSFELSSDLNVGPAASDGSSTSWHSAAAQGPLPDAHPPDDFAVVTQRDLELAHPDGCAAEPQSPEAHSDDFAAEPQNPKDFQLAHVRSYHVWEDIFRQDAFELRPCSSTPTHSESPRSAASPGTRDVSSPKDSQTIAPVQQIGPGELAAQPDPPPPDLVTQGVAERDAGTLFSWKQPIPDVFLRGVSTSTGAILSARDGACQSQFSFEASAEPTMEAVTLARDEAARVCAGMEQDLPLFRAQLLYLERVIDTRRRAVSNDNGAG